jgi:hypothetical protein
MNKGFIKVFRKIKDHWLYSNNEYLACWIKILLNVNHSDNKVLLSGKLFEVKRGESLISLDKWSDIFGKGWDKSKTRRFFELLKKDHMVETMNEQKTTRLIIINFDTYNTQRNDNETENEQKSTHKRNADETLATPNKNDKEVIKNDKEVKNKDLPTSDEVRSLFIGYLSSLNITDIDEEKLNAQLRLFIRYYIGDADQAGKWQLQRTKFNPKTCVKNWIDKNVNTYKSFKKVEPVQDDITCRCWDDLCGALKKYNPKCLPGKVFNYVKNEDQNGRYANWTWEQIWRAAKKLADYPEYQEKQERKITIENPEWKKNREKVNELLGGF